MGFIKNFVKTGLGLAGKHLMNWANTATGGLAGKLVNTVVDGANKHAGIIGKVASSIGQKLLSDETRNKISKFTDKALEYIPEGSVKTALTKINNAAQGRPVDDKPMKVEEPTQRIRTMEETLPEQETPRRKSRRKTAG